MTRPIEKKVPWVGNVTLDPLSHDCPGHEHKHAGGDETGKIGHPLPDDVLTILLEVVSSCITGDGPCKATSSLELR